MTSQQGAGQALRLTLPGASPEWHNLGGIDGLFHPDVAVPISAYGLDEDGARELAGRKGVALELVDVTAVEASAGAQAYADRVADGSIPPAAELGLESLTVPALKALADELGVEHKGLTKAPLIVAITAAQAQPHDPADAGDNPDPEG